MHPFPHHYRARAHFTPEQPVVISSEGLSDIESTPPPEFGGPEGHWSPETLLTASVADCFMLTFQAIARASRLQWLSLECDVEGVLDRDSGVSKFTHFNLQARLVLAAGMDAERAQKILVKSEKACLITASLSSQVHLDTDITFG